MYDFILCDAAVLVALMHFLFEAPVEFCQTNCIAPSFSFWHSFPKNAIAYCWVLFLSITLSGFLSYALPFCNCLARLISIMMAQFRPLSILCLASCCCLVFCCHFLSAIPANCCPFVWYRPSCWLHYKVCLPYFFPTFGKFSWPLVSLKYSCWSPYFCCPWRSKLNDDPIFWKLPESLMILYLLILKNLWFRLAFFSFGFVLLLLSNWYNVSKAYVGF